VETGISHLHALELPTPFGVGPITVYLADAPGEPLTLVDTGPLTSSTTSALEAALAWHGRAPRDLERILLTHAHVDHVGLAADLVATSGAQVLSHPWNVPELEDHPGDRQRRVEFYASILRQAGVPGNILQGVGRATEAMDRFARPVGVDHVVDEGDSLRLAGLEWQVLHTPGHAGGLICLYEPAGRTLLSSDHLLAGISSNPVVEPPPPGRQERLLSLVVYRASLQRVAAMDIARALPSHGPAIDDVPGLVAQRLEFHRSRVANVLQALRAGARSTWDVTQVLFPGRTPLDTFLAVSEVIGHLDLLEREGQIVAEPDGDAISWCLL
jgi:glyoxylase-like metal-dependent hydrolase (beta-lactamase superfamily II)